MHGVQLCNNVGIEHGYPDAHSACVWWECALLLLLDDRCARTVSCAVARLG